MNLIPTAGDTLAVVDLEVGAGAYLEDLLALDVDIEEMNFTMFGDQLAWHNNQPGSCLADPSYPLDHRLCTYCICCPFLPRVPVWSLSPH
jgi:hypothetical protein